MDDDVPAWASFSELDAYREFMRLSEVELRRRSAHVRFQPGLAIVEVAGVPRPCGLSNLAQDCKRIPRERWEERIRFHFTALFAAMEQPVRTGAEVPTFPQIARDLKLRLYPPDWLDAAGEDKVVFRCPAHDLVSVLVQDLPTMVVSILREDVARWGVSEDELFALAVRNVAAVGKLDEEVVEVVPGGHVTGLWDESFFTSTHALFLDAYLPRDVESAGALVIVPNRHAVAFHPLRRAALAAPVAEAMLEMALRMFEEGPGSLSPHVYWYCRGQLTWLPFSPVGLAADKWPAAKHEDTDTLAFTAPLSFTAMLARLEGGAR